MTTLECSCGQGFWTHKDAFVIEGHEGHAIHIKADASFQSVTYYGDNAPSVTIEYGNWTHSFGAQFIEETSIEIPKTCFIERHAPGCICGTL